MGKRARTNEDGKKAAAKAGNRDERITDVNTELELVLMQLQGLANGGNYLAAQCLPRILEVKGAVADIVDREISTTTLTDLRKMSQASSSSNDQTYRLAPLVAKIFGNEIAGMKNMEVTKKLAESAMSRATELGFLYKFCSSSGAVNWVGDTGYETFLSSKIEQLAYNQGRAERDAMPQ
jgi:hypothetical protein